MKPHILLLLAAVSMYTCSCSDSALPPVPPDGSRRSELPDSLPATPLPLDFDDDGTPDASINYVTVETTEFPPSGRATTLLRISCSAHCELLYRPNQEPQHFAQGEAIPLHSSSSAMWHNYSLDVASRAWGHTEEREEQWRSTWTTRGHYLPFRLGSGGFYRYGWLELRVDSLKGTLHVHDSYCSPVPQQEVRAGEK